MIVGDRVTTVDGRKRTIKHVLSNGWFGLSDGSYVGFSQLRKGWAK